MTSLFSLASLQAALLAHDLAGMNRPRFVVIGGTLGVLYVVLKVVEATRRRPKATALRGPSNPSFMWGVGKALMASPDVGTQYERWAEEYGGVYEVSWILGGKQTILCDPKAIAHLYAGQPWTYVLTHFKKLGTENVVGKGVLSAEGENHRRQRKALAPAFTNAAIRNLTPVFYNSAYKVKDAWESLIEASGNVIEIESWMNRVSLDMIGIAGFSHDFGLLDGKTTSVTDIFDAFGKRGNNKLDVFLILLAQTFPWLLMLPTPFSKLVRKLNDTVGDISNTLLEKSRKEKQAGILEERQENSILGLLIRAENQGNQLRSMREEVIAQAKILLIAGYQTTSISLTWALIELARNPDIQTRLRAELLEFGVDQIYDQAPVDLPYLDAVVHETLRMHPAVHTTLLMAAEDDVLPLSKPVQTRSGKVVDHISVAKGTNIVVPILSINRSELLWGPDAKEFKPERWLGEEGIPATAREIQGHRHLLTFTDGPKICLGKGFAIAELKIVLSVLVKNFVFEFPGGPDTPIEMVRGFLPWPKVAGEEGLVVPLRVRRFE